MNISCKHLAGKSGEGILAECSVVSIVVTAAAAAAAASAAAAVAVDVADDAAVARVTRRSHGAFVA